MVFWEQEAVTAGRHAAHRLGEGSRQRFIGNPGQHAAHDVGGLGQLAGDVAAPGSARRELGVAVAPVAGAAQHGPHVVLQVSAAMAPAGEM